MKTHLPYLHSARKSSVSPQTLLDFKATPSWYPRPITTPPHFPIEILTSTSKRSDSNLLFAMKVLSRTPRLNQLPKHRKILMSIFSSLPAFSTHVIYGRTGKNCSGPQPPTRDSTSKIINNFWKHILESLQ